MIVSLPFYLKFPTITDERGKLTVLDGWQHIPFAVKRVFWIYGVPGGSTRGGHAHKLCQQVLVAMAGSARVTIRGQSYVIDDPAKGLYVGPGISITLDDFALGTVLLVLCSHLFAEEDYIKDVTT